MVRGKKAINYIFFETLPSFILGLIVFILIILMFQVLRLTEFALVHGVDLWTISEIVGYICISLLPVLFPMSLLFAVIITYSRLSQDSEIIAFKAAGLSMVSLSMPAAILGVVVALISGQTSFQIAPWGNRQFEVLYTRLGNSKAAATIKAGTFSEGFFDLVVYANDVDSEHGHLKDVFIYNERDPDNPLTIIAKEGEVIPDPKNPGHSTLLRLMNGDIHRKSKTHTKIKFETYDIQLVDPIKLEEKEKSPQSMTLHDLRELVKDPRIKDEDRRTFQTELHKRWAIAVLCCVFAMLGVALGIQPNRRQQKAGGIIMCLGVIIVYWVMYIVLEGMARNGQLSPPLAIWTPNVVFALICAYLLKKISK